jgi:hypothetical protein
MFYTRFYCQPHLTSDEFPVLQFFYHLHVLLGYTADETVEVVSWVVCYVGGLVGGSVSAVHAAPFLGVNYIRSGEDPSVVLIPLWLAERYLIPGSSYVVFTLRMT